MCVVFGCIGALTSLARGADKSFPHSPRAHLVRFYDAVAGRRHTVTDLDGANVASCVGNCVLRISPGKYTVYIGQSYSRRLSVTDQDVDVTISRDDPTLQYIGLSTAIVGMAALIVGVGGVFYINFEGSSECDSACHERHSRNPLPWEILALGGVAATTVGWAMFGTALPSIEIGRSTVAAQPLQGGGLLAFKTTF